MRTITPVLASLSCLVPLFYSPLQGQEDKLGEPTQPNQTVQEIQSIPVNSDIKIRSNPSSTPSDSIKISTPEASPKPIEAPKPTSTDIQQPSNKTSKPSISSTTSKKAFEPFTGRVTKNKVRLRLQPSFDSQSIRDLNRDNLVIILGETDDFYAVKPTKDVKAYIFRTYVLDNVVEGTRVNIRLKPDLDAPVIAQLNSGDRVDGHIYAANNKWMEISLPASTRFYIAKEYIEKAGDADFIDRLDKRREEVYRLLNTTKAVADSEMQKPFNQVTIDGIVANYQRIIFDFKDFPEAGLKAQEYLNSLQEAYTKKKISFLEDQAKQSSQVLEQKNKKLVEELQAHKSKLSQLEQQMQKEKEQLQNGESSASRVPQAQLPYNMATWIPVENNLLNTWSQQTGNTDPSAFYNEQRQNSFVLKGIIDPYNRPVKNKPGDYMLLNASSKLPIAFIYSTQINLQDYVGHEVVVRVTPRPNFNYAFPAYFVLSVGE